MPVFLHSMLFFFLFAPVVKLGVEVHTFKLIYAILCSISIIRYSLIPRKAVPLVIFQCCAIIYFAAIYALARYQDAEMFNQSVLGLLIFLSALALVRLYVLSGVVEHSSQIISVTFWVVSIHSLVMVLQFISQEFAAALAVIVESSTSIGLPTVKGVSAGGGAALSASIAIICISYFQYINKKIRWYEIAAAIVNIFGIALSGRTGLVLLFMYTIAVIIRSGSARRLVIAVAVVTSSVWASVNIQEKYLDESTSAVIFRTLEAYYKYREYGVISTDTTTALSDMYFLPDMSASYIFGNGNYGREEMLPYIASDVMYIRVLFGGGIVGVFLAVAPFLVAFMSTRKHRFGQVVIRRPMGLEFVIVSALILNGKEMFLLGTAVYGPIIALLFAVAMTNGLRGKRNHTNYVME